MKRAAVEGCIDAMYSLGRCCRDRRDNFGTYRRCPPADQALWMAREAFATANCNYLASAFLDGMVADIAGHACNWDVVYFVYVVGRELVLQRTFGIVRVARRRLNRSKQQWHSTVSGRSAVVTLRCW
jgi:hypothetical protein